MPTLRISTEKVCYVVVKARQFDVKVAPEWLNGGSNPADDGMTRVLEDYKDDPTLMELRSYLRAMNEDELEDLIALTLLGRGDYTIDEWEDLMIEARRAARRRSRALPDRHSPARRLPRGRPERVRPVLRRLRSRPPVARGRPV